MRRERTVTAADARRAVFVTTARRTVRSGAVWGLVFGVYVVSSASTFVSSYPTAAERARFARSLSGNAGLAALLGAARDIGTVSGFTAWRALGVLSIVGAIWGLLIATRVTRGEEDAGRWELLLVGRTTRRLAAAQAVVALGAGLATLWVVTAVLTLLEGRARSVHFSTSGALFFATALVAGAALFLAVGVLLAQLASSRRQANGIGAAVLGGAFLVRMVADSTSGLAWVRWASPLGWIEELHPLTGSRPFALVPVVLLVVACVTVALAIAGARDLGASVLPSRESPPPRLGLLGGSGGLAVRLVRPVALGWIAGLGVLGLVLGLVAQSAANAVSGSATIERILSRLGGRSGGAVSYLGFAFLTAAALVAFAAAGQVSAARAEEADGYVDNLLVRRVARMRWLGERLAVGAVVVVGACVVAGVAAWLGAASQDSGVGLGQLLKAGVNIAGPALFVLGVGMLVFGARPRLASSVAYGLVVWSFLVEIVAGSTSTNHWLLDTSVLSHITPVPAAPPDWLAVGVLAGIGLVAALVGLVLFDRRDLVSA